MILKKQLIPPLMSDVTQIIAVNGKS